MKLTVVTVALVVAQTTQTLAVPVPIYEIENLIARAPAPGNEENGNEQSRSNAALDAVANTPLGSARWELPNPLGEAKSAPSILDIPKAAAGSISRPSRPPRPGRGGLGASLALGALQTGAKVISQQRAQNSNPVSPALSSLKFPASPGPATSSSSAPAAGSGNNHPIITGIFGNPSPGKNPILEKMGGGQPLRSGSSGRDATRGRSLERTGSSRTRSGSRGRSSERKSSSSSSSRGRSTSRSSSGSSRGSSSSRRLSRARSSGRKAASRAGGVGRSSSRSRGMKVGTILSQAKGFQRQKNVQNRKARIFKAKQSNARKLKSPKNKLSGQRAKVSKRPVVKGAKKVKKGKRDLSLDLEERGLEIDELD